MTVSKTNNGVSSSDSVRSFADLLQVQTSAVYRWIAKKKIDVAKTNGHYSIVWNDKAQALIQKRIKDRNRPQPAWTPRELRDYSKWHELLDEFTWLLKVCYSPPEVVKSKKFRMDRLFARYLRSGMFSLGKVRSAFRPKLAMPEVRIVDDLKRGWYNELAYAMPLKPSTVGISFADITTNKQLAGVRFAFPSWRVTTAYYAVYFYLRAITLQNQDRFRLDQHGATISCFKNGAASAIGGSLWRFPFDIAYVPGQRVSRRSTLVSQVGHARHQYSRHPRGPNRSPIEILDNILGTFRRRSHRKVTPERYTLFDFLHDF